MLSTRSDPPSGTWIFELFPSYPAGPDEAALPVKAARVAMVTAAVGVTYSAHR